MQQHYDNILKGILELRTTIRKSSLNRGEYDAIFGRLKQLEEQTLPMTLTWITKEEEAELKPKSFVDAIADAFVRYQKEHNL